MNKKVVFIMGVAGSGKTTIGRLLSARTGYPFYDGDDFHPQKNIDKMKAGQPLTDEDRWPWLDNLHDLATTNPGYGSIIIACSALKQSYRDRLSRGIEQHCTWIFLNGEYKIISERIKNRLDHYMPSALLQSQFDVLELPANAIEVDIDKTPEEIVTYIVSCLK